MELRVLGPPAVRVEDTSITAISGARYGLVAHLAAHHPHGATRDEILDAFYPDIDTHTASTRFRSACTAIRATLRTATGHPESWYILHHNGRYRLDPNAFTVDLWHMQHALHEARAIPDGDDTTLLAALDHATTAYHGEYATGIDHTWATEYATTYRNHAVDALARIAEIHEADHPDTATTALHQAIDHDPLCEELYQRLIRIQGRLHRTDAVRRTLTACTRALETIHTEPSPTTTRIAHRQLHGHTPPSTSGASYTSTPGRLRAKS